MKTIEQALGEIAKGTPQAGEAFFEALVTQLVQVLGVKFAFVAVPNQAHPPIRSMQTLAGCNDGKLLASFSYDLPGTPCEELQTEDACFYPQGVQELFPQDKLLVKMGIHAYLGVPLHSSKGHLLGILVVLHDEPYRDEKNIAQSVLKIYGQRAATELERIGEAGRGSALSGVEWR